MQKSWTQLCRRRFSFNSELADWCCAVRCTFYRWCVLQLTTHLCHVYRYVMIFSFLQSNPLSSPLKFIGVVVYLVAMISQISVNCYYGSRLSHESDSITLAIYTSQWMERDEKCKRAMRILVERSMRPMTIFAGGLFDLSLPTFVRVTFWEWVFCSSENELMIVFCSFCRYAKRLIRTSTCSVLWTRSWPELVPALLGMCLLVVVGCRIFAYI